MKLIIILLTAAALQVSAKGHSQGITLSLKNVSLKTAFSQIRKQAPSFDFFYDESWLKDAKNVSIEVKNAPLNDVLEQCFKDQPFTFSIAGSIIIVQPKNPSTTANKNSPPLPITIKGVIVNEANEPVEGASVKVKNTDKGTSTNERGEFIIAGVNEEETLEISHISYEYLEIPIKNKTEIRISLKSKVGKLRDIIINTGYQTLNVNQITGSVATIKEDQLDQRVATDVVTKLEGISNGLTFNKDPQTGANKLRIRGETTIFGYDKPLIVVDGFTYPFEKINEINPYDVDNITILKDAAAASIWGVQAGNGVIVITLKKGRLNQPLKIDLNVNTTISEKPDLSYAPLMNSSDFIDLETYLFKKNRYVADLNDLGYKAVSPVVEILNRRKLGQITASDSASQIDALRSKDWKRDFLNHVYRRAVNQQYQVNLSGGADKVSYYFSAGYDKGQSNLIGDNNHRYTVNGNANFRLIKNLDLKFGLSYSELYNSNNGSGGTIPNLYPYMDLVDANGNQLPVPQHRAVFEDTIAKHGYLDWKYFPIQERNYQDNKSKSYSTRLLGGLRFSLLKGLSLEITYQYYRAIGNAKSLTTVDAYSIRNNMNRFAILSGGNFIGTNYPNGGTLGISNSNLVGQNGRAKLDYNKIFGDHSIIALAGFDLKDESAESNGSTLLGYDNATGSFTTPNTFTLYPVRYPSGSSNLGGGNALGLSYSSSISRFRSYYGIIGYSYKSRYSLQGSLRFDGSNYFGVKTNNKTVPLWSAGGKWDISKEGFYKFKESLPRLSLRMTYGYNGNLSPSTVAITTFRYAGTANYTGLPFATISNIPNPELRWEKSGQLNIGLDFSLKNNIINGSIEYFKKNGKDLIGDAPLDPTSGVSRIRGNFSDMESRGIDVQIESQNINKNFKWRTVFIFNYVKETISRYDIPSLARSYLGAYKGTTIPIVGYPIRSVFSYHWAGLDPVTGDPRIILGDSINKSYSLATISKLKPEDLVYNGRYDPPYTGSILNSISYKGVTLTVNVTYKFGHVFRAGSINYFNLFSNMEGWYNYSNRDFARRWQKPGDETFTNVPSIVYPDNSSGQRDDFYNSSDILIEKADHIRLQFINLDYSLNAQLLNRLHLQHLNIFCYANNLGILWRANDKGIDPDYPYLAYPPAKTYSLGIRVGF